jgi:hypothetical protein
MKPTHIVIQISGPRGSHPGHVEEGFFTSESGVVTLTTQHGVPVTDGRGRKITALVVQGQNARSVAARLLRSTLHGPTARNGFRGVIVYPDMRAHHQGRRGHL